MPIAVIHGLEVVEIDEEQPYSMVLALGESQAQIEFFDQERAVGQARELVVGRQKAYLFLLVVALTHISQ
jgi:hypothetical protein